MKIRYIFGCLMLISFSMHLTMEFLIAFCETSSLYWYHSKTRELNPDSEILVLGDSQIISGITPEMISGWEKITLSQIQYAPRPSEQPEGILDEYLFYISKLSKVKKIYVNISPISLSKNTVTDAHKQLFTSFGVLRSEHITNEYLRKSYFANGYDFFWKLTIQIFPFFALNPNFSKLAQTGFEKNLLEARKLENQIIKTKISEDGGSWVWRDKGNFPVLAEDSKQLENSTTVFLNQRNQSQKIWKDCFRLWKEKGITVVLLRLPFSPQMEADIVKTKSNLPLERFLESEGLSYFDLREDGFEDSKFFADFTHLNQTGRSVLLNKLGIRLFDKASPTPKSM
ncbi:hypothetical protein P3G55_11695 [Leptospira sp. 96542]|nr:hypothetical protein [Leptospira sp. 96542]